MPLDPFFTERLRVHRRYLLKQALRRLRTWWGAIGRAPDTSSASGATRRTTAARGASPDSASTPSARARARHRRAAWAWDRDELANAGTPGPGIPTSHHEIDVPGFPSVTVRVYRPADDDTVRPAVLYFYGGAFRIGGIDYPTTDAACRRRAAQADVVIVAVSYALAPEHRFPTPVEQAHAALEWLVRQATELRVDPTRIAVAGTSAGAGIAASLTLMNRDRAALPIRLQVLEVPVTDLTGRWVDLRPSWRLGIPALFVLRELRSISRTYLPDSASARHPYASPLRAASHADLPTALVLTAEFDALRRDGEQYAARLRRAGVAATAVRYLGVTHDTPIYTGALPAARRWDEQVIGAYRSLHESDRR